MNSNCKTCNFTTTIGTQPETLAFDPWGRRRNPTNWSFTNVPATFLFDRGYTGHEHLDRFGLINMNGRVYDPALARFLSPDPFITNPANSQNYNRYSYCFNNPLKYTDPSGYHQKPLDWDMENPIIGGGGFIGSIANGTFRPYGQWSTPSSSGYSYDWGLGQYTNNGEVTSFTNVFNNVVRPNLGPLTGDLLAQFNKQMGFNEKAGSEKAFENKMKLLAARNVGYGKSFNDPGGDDDGHWGTGAYIGGTFAPIIGPTVEIGFIIDSHSQTYAYLSLGIAVGAEASGGGGVIVVPYKNFNGQNWFGDGFGGSINVPGGGFEYSQSMYDTQYRAFKGNLGIGLGGSVNASFTFKIPIIPDIWTRPWRHF